MRWTASQYLFEVIGFVNWASSGGSPGMPFPSLLEASLIVLKWAASYGINVIPYQRMQKYVTSIDLRSAVQDNVAFKISFGSTFALAAFVHF